MSTLKDIVKGGWHPKSKNGSSGEKWRDDFKGLNQVSDWIGKGKESNSAERGTPYPIQSLKDPASFGPPPKRLDYSGEDATTIEVPLNDEKNYPLVRSRAGGVDDKGTLKRSKPPPLPHRIGCEYSSALKPSPTDFGDEMNVNNEGALASAKINPRLPPRLPPRAKSTNALNSFSKNEPVSQDRIIEIKPSNLLEKKVRKFDTTILSSSPANRFLSATSVSPSNEQQSSSSHALPFLQTNTSNSEGGTSFSEKKAAVKTISSLRNNPASVSFSDVVSTAHTANNFRERHGHQVKSGLNIASKINQKYGTCETVVSHQTRQKSPCHVLPRDQNEDSCKDNLVKKKSPPPPLPTRKTDSILSNNKPPLIPIWTKPARNAS